MIKRLDLIPRISLPFWLTTVFVSFLLTGCNEKDAKYFYKHPEELKQVIDDCQNRNIRYLMEDNSHYLYSAERINIKNENELNDMLALIDDSIKRTTSLRDDNLCQQAAIANQAVKTKNLKAAQMEGITIWTQLLDINIKQLNQAKTMLEHQYNTKKKYIAMTFQELDDYYNDPACKSWSGTLCSQEEYLIISELWKEKRKPIIEARIKELEALGWDEFNQISQQDCKNNNLDCEIIPQVLKTQNERQLSKLIDQINEGKLVDVYTQISKGYSDYCNGGNTNLCWFYRDALSTSKEKIKAYLQSNETVLKQEYNRCYELAQTWSANKISADYLCNIVRIIASDKYKTTNNQLGQQLFYYGDKIENLIDAISK